jgi:LysM repeat protein
MEKKKMPLPKKKPRHASPKHRMNTEKTKPLGRNKGGKMSLPISPRQMAQKKLKENYDFTKMFIRDKDALKRKKDIEKTLLGKIFGGGSGKDLGGRRFARQEAVNMLKKEHPKLVKRLTKKASGGKLKMVEKDGKKVPFFAADGKGKMAMGGMMKKKGMKKGGMMKKGYAKGGPVKVKSGDTLSQIAKSKGVTLKALLGANPNIKNANQIRVGQSIKIPTNMPGSKSSNPYAGIKRGQMADMDVKNKSEKRQRRATRSMQTQVKQGGSRTTPTPSKAAAVKESKSGREAMLAKARKLRDSKKAAKPTGKTLANTPKSGAAKVTETRMAKLANKNRLARRAGGGMMKKKSYAKGGMMKKKGMAKGGVMRGAGAATRGKRFGRAG